MTSKAYKISVAIPQEFVDTLMDRVNDVMEQPYPGYDRTFSIIESKGTWRSLEGSNPYNGEIGKITIADEMKVEFAVSEQDLKNVISVIRDVHPYEEPAIDILPLIMWKDIIDL